MAKYYMRLKYLDAKGIEIGSGYVEILRAETDEDAVEKAKRHVNEMNKERFDDQKRVLLSVTKEIFVNPFPF